MRRVGQGMGVALVATLAYLLLWPVPIRPVAWQVAPAPGYAGPHAVNNRLANLKTISLGDEEGPEHVALGPDGKLYVAVASGKVLRMSTDGSAREVFADTGGRVLGFDFDASGALIAADAFKGLLAIAPSGQVRPLVTEHAGQPIRYADAVVVARNGKMFFSDASTRFAPKDWGGTFEASVLDIIEQAATGRILEHDPATGSTRVVVKGLSFANGVALSADQQTLFVAETGRYRIWKVAVAAQEADVAVASAQVSLLFDNLPGYPDNLMAGREGRLWVGLTKPRGKAVDGMAGQPWLRAMTLRLPRAMWPVPQAYGHVFAFDEAGRVLADLQDPSGAYPEATSVTETPERLYIQSLHAKSLGWLPASR